MTRRLPGIDTTLPQISITHAVDFRHIFTYVVITTDVIDDHMLAPAVILECCCCLSVAMNFLFFSLAFSSLQEVTYTNGTAYEPVYFSADACLPFTPSSFSFRCFSAATRADACRHLYTLMICAARLLPCLPLLRQRQPRAVPITYLHSRIEENAICHA